MANRRHQQDGDDAALRRQLNERPDWVRRAWATPAARLGLSLAFLATSAFLLATGVGGVVGFVSAVILVGAFGAQAAEAVADLVRGTDSLPVFHRLGRWADGHLPAVALVVVALGALYFVAVA